MPVVPASIKLTAFTCPHCGTQTTQFWFALHSKSLRGEGDKLPHLVDAEFIDQLRKKLEKTGDPEEKEMVQKHLPAFEKMALGLPVIADSTHTVYEARILHNLHVSKCMECSEIAIWRYDTLLYPPSREGPIANSDLPADVLRDYEEASAILNLSPRGAAALLRLAIEKLVTHFDAKGADINAKIAWLVAKGLPEQIQQALDAVRVIGNEAVHPGLFDLRDDRDTAAELFELVNIIAEERITRPKRVKAMYEKIPDGKRKAIEERDAKRKKAE